MGKAKGKQRQDKLYHLAKEQGYRSRAAFKLLQPDARFRFVPTARSVLNLCAAPGGWVQVAVNHAPVGAFVVGVDLVPIRRIRGTHLLTEDITTTRCRAAVRRLMDSNGISAFDIVLHDGSPNVGGAWAQEATSQSALVILTCFLLVLLRVEKNLKLLSQQGLMWKMKLEMVIMRILRLLKTLRRKWILYDAQLEEMCLMKLMSAFVTKKGGEIKQECKREKRINHDADADLLEGGDDGDVEMDRDFDEDQDQEGNPFLLALDEQRPTKEQIVKQWYSQICSQKQQPILLSGVTLKLKGRFYRGIRRWILAKRKRWLKHSICNKMFLRLYQQNPSETKRIHLHLLMNQMNQRMISMITERLKY